MGQVTHALLTRPPLSHPGWNLPQQAASAFGWGASFDLHVLSTPPAFILSQDQTLMLKSWTGRINACVRPCGRLYDYSVISYPVRLLFVSLSGNELNRVGLFLSNNYSEKYFLFFGVVSLLNYQGSLPDLSSRSLLPQQMFFTASANTILSKILCLVNTFFK